MSRVTVVPVPREMTLLYAAPVDARGVAEAVVGYDRSWGIRALDDGSVMQVCREADHPMLTVLGVRRVSSAEEVARILPDARPLLQVPFWWVDAVVPSNADGDAGIVAARAVADAAGAVCIVHDP